MQVLHLDSLKDSDVILHTQKPLSWVWEITVLRVKFSAITNMIGELNYLQLLNKVNGLALDWKTRSLTLNGRVLIVNTLLVSQFVYKFLNLSSPSIATLGAFTHLVKDLLWPNKRPTAAYDKLTLPYTRGGLQLVDLYLKDVSLKAAWIQRLMFAEHLHFWVEKFLPLKHPDIWYCNISRKDILAINNRNQKDVWWDIWVAWSEYIY